MKTFQKKGRNLLMLILLASGLWISQTINAQQDPMYAQYHFNGLVLNPAYAGTHEVLSATLLYRNQWVNMPGAPKTLSFSADAPFMQNKFGIGISVVSDKIGITNKNAVTGIYSYKLHFEGNGILALGLQMGVSFFKSSYADVNYAYKNQSTDQAFMSNYNDAYPNIGFGAYYYTNSFYAGISLPKFINNSMLGGFLKKPEGFSYEEANVFFITSGYIFDINPDLKLKPSALLKYVNGANPQLDLNATAWMFETFGVGVSYRSFDAINAYTEVKVLPQLFMGYAFEYALTNLRKFNSGTHELMLRYDFDFAHPRVITPRYF